MERIPEVLLEEKTPKFCFIMSSTTFLITSTFICLANIVHMAHACDSIVTLTFTFDHLRNVLPVHVHDILRTYVQSIPPSHGLLQNTPCILHDYIQYLS
jgi:hypothetical protein